MDSEQYELAAYHEAGHALFFSAFSVPVDGVAIYDDNTGKVFATTTIREHERQKSLIEKCREACIDLAGAAAESIQDGTYDAMIHLLYLGGRDDWEHVKALGFDDSLIEGLMEVVYEVIEEHWHRVSALAEALLSDSYQTTDDVAAIFAGVSDHKPQIDKRLQYVLDSCHPTQKQAA